MAAAPDARSISMDHESTNVDSQATFVLSMAERVRQAAVIEGLSSMALADAIGVKRSAMTNYWNGKRPYPVEAIPHLATHLRTSVDYLFSGRRDSRASLVDAAQADWIEVPEYDLRNLTDETLGDPLATSPIRRDWLYNLTRATTDLWLTRLLSDYPAAQLAEDQLVLCRTIERATLAEGNVCLWRFNSDVLIGRYSVVPDASFVDTPDGPRPASRYATAYLDPALGITSSGLVVPPSAIEAGRYHLVGRILGAMIRPI